LKIDFTNNRIPKYTKKIINALRSEVKTISFVVVRSENISLFVYIDVNDARSQKNFDYWYRRETCSHYDTKYSGKYICFIFEDDNC